MSHPRPGTTDADGQLGALPARGDQDEERRTARTRRTQWKFSLALGVLWVALAVNHWRDDDGDPVLPWLFTVLAVVQVTTTFLVWRKVRDEPSS